MKRKRDLILGLGEIGQALHKVLKKNYLCDTFDKNKKIPQTGIQGLNYRAIHICYPYFEGFETETLNYLKSIYFSFAIIHSTVLVNTTQIINDQLEKAGFKRLVVHSPVEGMHPHLKALKTFTKFIGYDDEETGKEVAEYFKKTGIKCQLMKNSKTTELGKLLSSFQYTSHIWLSDVAKQICDELEVDYGKAVMEYNQAYNQGYDKLKPRWEKEREPIRRDFHRPILIPDIRDGLGGHCLYSNLKLLKKQVNHPLLEILQKIGQKNENDKTLQKKKQQKK